jgi:hypothetical protein
VLNRFKKEIAMGRKRNRRQHKVIGLKVYADCDADIINWWESIAVGERSDILRDLIRMAIGGHVVKRQAPMDIGLTDIKQDTDWIRSALNDLPAYLERLFHNVQPVTNVQHQPTRAPDVPVLKDDDVARREARMKKTLKW